MERKQVRIGPFRLCERLGAGGMGEVWRALHDESGRAVAFKVIVAEHARRRAYREDFIREVRAAARLGHPNVIAPLDFGMVPESAVRSSEGTLVAGSPYLLMPLAKGSLAELTVPMAGPLLVRVLMDVLRGVGHAHARGVIHRDLKPGNVLLLDTEGRLRCALSDFGIAHASERHGPTAETLPVESESQQLVGTPGYMAPEQFEGRWRDYGPWTDLYQIGVMAWALACGTLPYESDSWAAVALKHLHEPLPPLPSHATLPPSFQPWLARMCAKSCARRFQWAADAARELAHRARVQGWDPDAEWSAHGEQGDELPVEGCGDSSASVSSHPGPAGPAATVLIGAGTPDSGLHTTGLGYDATFLSGSHTLRAGTGEDQSVEEGTAGEANRLHGADVAQEPRRRARTNSAETLRISSATDVEVDTFPVLSGAGAGLFGMRTIPLVDREGCREVLTRTLREVEETSRPRVLLLEGGAGVGKSRLLQWLCETAHEGAVATPVHVSHEERRGPTHGMSRMVVHYCRALGLEGEALSQRIQTVLERESSEDVWEHDVLATLAAHAALPVRASGSVPMPEERDCHVALRQFLRRISTRRPVIVWMDDVHLASDTLDFVSWLLGQPAERLPVLLAGTVRTDQLPLRKREREQIARLALHPETVVVEVLPLDAPDHEELVGSLLGLVPELSSAVCQRTAGNPLFALQLVGSWVSRGALRATSEGFEVGEGVVRQVPDDLHGLWRQRVERALRGCGASAVEVFELGAALGVGVDADELVGSLQRYGVEVDSVAVEAMVSAGLIVIDEGGWHFAHPLLRDSIERGAREAGRWNALNRACADGLGDVHKPGVPGVAARRAQHLRDAGEPLAAAPLLLMAIEESLESVNVVEARGGLARLREVIDGLAMESDAPLRGAARALESDILRLSGETGAARELAHQILSSSGGRSWAPARARAHVLLSNIARQEGRSDDALEHALQARALFGRQEDAEGLARAELALAITQRVRGEVGLARNHYRRALALFATGPRSIGWAHCQLGLGHLARHDSAWTEAANRYRQAEEAFSRRGALLHQAHCINGQAEVARYRGKLTDAAAGYRRAEGILRALGAAGALICGINLALVELERGHVEDAERSLQELLDSITKKGQGALLPYVHAGLLVCAADGGRLVDCRHHFEQLRAQLVRVQTVDKDLASLSERAARTLTCRGNHELGDAVAELAHEQYSALKDTAALARIAALGSRPS